MAMFYAEELFQIFTSILLTMPSLLLNLAMYVLSAVSVYVIARRRGLDKPWLAWIPVVNVWLLGSLSDQYQYVVRRKDTSRRKWLLALNLIKPVLVGLVIGFGVYAMLPVGYGIHWQDVMVAVGFAVPLAVIAVAAEVLRFVALYDVYRSLDPDNAVLFLVLAIFFDVTEPFFLFFNRDKDGGMPPRREVCE
jgi:hypothetical protein